MPAGPTLCLSPPTCRPRSGQGGRLQSRGGSCFLGFWAGASAGLWEGDPKEAQEAVSQVGGWGLTLSRHLLTAFGPAQALSLHLETCVWVPTSAPCLPDGTVF